MVSIPANGAITNQFRPTYSGTARASSTVTVYVDNVAIGTTPSNAGGSWSFTQPSVLSDGTHFVEATATDSNGNTSTRSARNTFTVDTTPVRRSQPT